jgi:hypothetical protein
MIDREPQKMVITLKNVSPADAIALKKMFQYMESLGKRGSSRWCSFFADGDGSFRPKVSFEYPIELPELKEISGEVVYDKENRKFNKSIFSSTGDFMIDSDEIAWEIYHEEDDDEDFENSRNKSPFTPSYNDGNALDGHSTASSWEEANGRGFWGSEAAGYYYDKDVNG